MLTLAIDTSSRFCAAAVFDDASGLVAGERTEDIAKGHSERVIAVIESALGAAGASHGDIGRIAAAAGPGSFTGIRVGLAVARGLSLARVVPAVGVSLLDALAQGACRREGTQIGRLFVAIDAGREEIFGRLYDSGEGIGAPFVLSVAEAASRLSDALDANLALCGSGAPAVLAKIRGSGRLIEGPPHPAIADIARLGARLEVSANPAEPLYLRAAGASPQSGFAVARA